LHISEASNDTTARSTAEGPDIYMTKEEGLAMTAASDDAREEVMMKESLLKTALSTRICLL
jgi:hypothetical protein